MAKKIKSFTVDEEIYNRLVSMFKKYGAKTSISLYLNNKLEEMLAYLEEIEQAKRGNKSTVPMSFVIDEMVRRHRERSSSETDMEEVQVGLLFEVENDYIADQKGIPREFYIHLLSDKFVLSRDKKFIIEKETGKKYISDKEHLYEVCEIKE